MSLKKILFLAYMGPMIGALITMAITRDGELFKDFLSRLFNLKLANWRYVPILEELGWRPYGVDALRSKNSILRASLIFGSLWAIWHLPVFFIEGSYISRTIAVF